MSPRGSVTAALCFATALAGYALLPKLLPAPGNLPGGALGTGLGAAPGVVVVPRTPDQTAVPHATPFPAQGAAGSAGAVVGPAASA